MTTLTTTSVTGRISLPNNVTPNQASVEFTLTQYDTDAVGDITVPPIHVIFPLDGAGDLSAQLWPNARGTRSTLYNVNLLIKAETTEQRYAFGKIEVPVTGPVDLNSLLL